MNARPKRLPRLWCARMGLLPFDGLLPVSAASAGAVHRPPVIASSPGVTLAPLSPVEFPPDSHLSPLNCSESRD
jgi:hypothetical protein